MLFARCLVKEQLDSCHADAAASKSEHCLGWVLLVQVGKMWVAASMVSYSAEGFGALAATTTCVEVETNYPAAFSAL